MIMRMKITARRHKWLEIMVISSFYKSIMKFVREFIQKDLVNRWTYMVLIYNVALIMS